MRQSSVVVFENVTKTYQMGETTVSALKGVSLKIEKQKFSMISGPSGSGKTTLLNLIGCLDSASTGLVQVCDEEIAKLSDDAISEFRAKNIAFIFQTFNLIPVLSAFENVEYSLILLGIPPKQRKEQTMAILDLVGLADRAHHWPNQLSGGQRQRVAIARALVKNPSIVLADEPTANLDSRTGAAIIGLMRKAQEQCGTTFIISSHDPQLISHADISIFIHDGIIVDRLPTYSSSGAVEKK